MMQLIISRDKASPTRVGLPGELRTLPGCPPLGEVPGAAGKQGEERGGVVVTALWFSHTFPAVSPSPSKA